MEALLRLAAAFMLAFSLSGCAVYQHRLVEPVEFAGPIDAEGVFFEIEPLEYHAALRRTRLTLRINNPGGQPVTLLGQKSYIVDPAGETRGVLGGPIAPGSYITMALPPDIEAVRVGPRVGVGVGVGTGRGVGVGVGGGVSHDPWSRHPTYVRDAAPMWRWGTGDVRMRLVFERGEERFEHELAFERVRAN